MTRIIALLLTAVALVGLPRESAAQHFSFGFGHHTDRHYDYDYWHHQHWAPPARTVYVYPASPAVQPSYAVQPNYTPAAIKPVDRAKLADRTPAKPAAAPRKNARPSGGVTITNRCNEKLAVVFLMDGKDADLDDGASQSFPGAAASVVEFDRGGDFGSARMELVLGDYEFVIDDKGWQLVRVGAKSESAESPVAKKNTLPATTR